MKKRIISLTLALAMVVSLGGAAVAASPSDYTDLPDSSHFTYNGVVAAIQNGIMSGTGGSSFSPNQVITRAEAAIYLVNVMGAFRRASLSGITDVPVGAWYADRLAIAVQMGVIAPVGGLLRPEELVTREEAFDMMAKAVKLSSAYWGFAGFTDGNEVSTQYASSIQALVSGKYIQGIPAGDGKFALNPKGTMTRGEFATLFGNVFQGFVTSSGVTSSVRSGNVVVKSAGATLKNLTVRGDLIIGDGVGGGEVTLDNVKVEGRLVVRGGGQNSIIITGGSVIGEIVVSRVDGAVRVTVSDDSNVSVIYVDDGSDNVIIQGDVGRVVIDADVPVTLQGGTVGTVTVTVEAAEVTLAADVVVERLTIQAADVTVDTARGAVIETLTVSSAAPSATVTGSGTIITATVNANNAAIAPTPQTTTTGSNVTGTTVGGSSVASGTTTTPSSGSGAGGGYMSSGTGDSGSGSGSGGGSDSGSDSGSGSGGGSEDGLQIIDDIKIYSYHMAPGDGSTGEPLPKIGTDTEGVITSNETTEITGKSYNVVTDVVWTPNHNSAAWETEYVATVTLKAAAGYKFEPTLYYGTRTLIDHDNTSQSYGLFDGISHIDSTTIKFEIRYAARYKIADIEAVLDSPNGYGSTPLTFSVYSAAETIGINLNGGTTSTYNSSSGAEAMKADMGSGLDDLEAAGGIVVGVKLDNLLAKLNISGKFIIRQNNPALQHFASYDDRITSYPDMHMKEALYDMDNKLTAPASINVFGRTIKGGSLLDAVNGYFNIPFVKNQNVSLQISYGDNFSKTAIISFSTFGVTFPSL